MAAGRAREARKTLEKACCRAMESARSPGRGSWMLRVTMAAEMAEEEEEGEEVLLRSSAERVGEG
jgi:hypothetical protein